MSDISQNQTRTGSLTVLESVAAWLLGLLWILPLAYAVWTAFHPAANATRFDLSAPLTLRNFAAAWEAAPFARYFANTTMLVTMVLAAQLVLGTLAAYGFARFEFKGKDFVFLLVPIGLRCPSLHPLWALPLVMYLDIAEVNPTALQVALAMTLAALVVAGTLRRDDPFVAAG